MTEDIPAVVKRSWSTKTPDQPGLLLVFKIFWEPSSHNIHLEWQSENCCENKKAFIISV